MDDTDKMLWLSARNVQRNATSRQSNTVLVGEDEVQVDKVVRKRNGTERNGMERANAEHWTLN